MKILRFPVPADRRPAPAGARAPRSVDAAPAAAEDARMLLGIAALQRPLLDHAMARRPAARAILAAFRVAPQASFGADRLP